MQEQENYLQPFTKLSIQLTLSNSSKKVKMKIKEIITIKRILTIAAGALLGYAYYYFIGCNSGQCPITSNPLNSTLYGAFMGLILALPVKKKDKEAE